MRFTSKGGSFRLVTSAVFALAVHGLTVVEAEVEAEAVGLERLDTVQESSLRVLHHLADPFDSESSLVSPLLLERHLSNNNNDNNNSNNSNKNRNRGNTNNDIIINHRQLWTGSSAYPPIGQKITGLTPGDSIGSSLALSADGTTLAIGSQTRQKVFLYEHVGTTWEARGIISYGGQHVSMNSDGTRVSTVQGSTVYVFQVGEDGVTWSEVFSAVETNINFSRGVSLSPDGKTVGASGIDGANNNGGIVKVWNEPVDGEGVNWEPIALISVADGTFGYSVGVHTDLILVGNPTIASTDTNAGRVYIYQRNGMNWNETQFDGDVAGEYMGASLSIAENGDKAVVCAPNANSYAGYCRFLVKDSSLGTWQVSSLNDVTGEPSEYLGERVALSRDGTTVAISGGFRFGKDAAASTTRGTIRLLSLESNTTDAYTSAISPIYEVENGFLGHGLALSADAGKLAISDPQFAIQGGGTNGEVRVYFTKRINLDKADDFSTTFEGCTPTFDESDTVVTCAFTTSPYAYSVATAKDGTCGNYQVSAGGVPTISGSNVVEYTPPITTEEKNSGKIVEKVFCVRSDVMTAIDSSGTLMNVDSSKTEVTLSLDFNTEGSFTAGLSTSVFEADTTTAEATRSVSLDSYQCDENGDATTLQLTVGQVLHICIETPSDVTDVSITDVESLTLKDFLAKDIRNPIVDGQVDFITEKDCSFGSKCIVGTLLVPSIFDDFLNDESLIIQVVGVANIAYTTGRRLGQQNLDLSDRSLQVNPDQSSFFMSFDVKQRERLPLVVGPRSQEDLPLVARISSGGMAMGGGSSGGWVRYLSVLVGGVLVFLAF